MNIELTSFGHLPSGEEVSLIKLQNKQGMSVSVSTYGASICSILTPDKEGNLGETVLGFNKLENYLEDHPFIGTIVGRVANRISNASFTINGKLYELTKNNGEHHLHGGPTAWHRQNWSYQIFSTEKKAGVILELLSPDGSESYPGNIFASIVFTLRENNEVEIEYICHSDQDTILNLTHHEYFNLKDGGKTSALDHLVQINASSITESDSDVCPTGNILNVEGTPFDFKSLKKIKDQLILKEGEVIPGQGFDHNYILSDAATLKHVAVAKETSSGRQLDIYSTKECVQFYTSGHLDGSCSRGDQVFKAYHGFCLEPQSYPDAINQENFPSIVLKKGELYNHKTIYKYSTF